MTIENPVDWNGAQRVNATQVMGSVIHAPAPVVQRISITDLRNALAKGFGDFEAYRSDVIFLYTIYPVVGLVLAWCASGKNLLPLLFPLASGFALIGPFAALGLYEMSRQREQGVSVRWANAFHVIHAPAVRAIAALGGMLIAIFLLWLAAAWIIFQNTLGPESPSSLASFLRDVFMTDAGHRMIIVGVGVGFLFALLAMCISVVSLPLLLDRHIGLYTAIRTSVRAVLANPAPMAIWGLIVTAGLVIGSASLFIGLVVVLPVLGHATWHLYRKLVPR
jgi:uncharacterized membrane protein